MCTKLELSEKDHHWIENTDNVIVNKVWKKSENKLLLWSYSARFKRILMMMLFCC